MHRSLVVSFLVLASCRSAPVPRPEFAPTRCGLHDPTAALLQTEDGASLWFKSAGRADGPVVVYLHGGPCYNAYGFEQAVGRRLEQRLQMVYWDHRGCGRSFVPDSRAPLGMETTLADIERLRTRLGVARIWLLGHSFGGIIALEYARKHREHVAGVILVDITADLANAWQHQLSTLGRVAPDRFPQQAETLRRLLESDRNPFDKLQEAYRLLGRRPLQRSLFFASDQGQALNEAWDEASGLSRCGDGRGAQVFRENGYLLAAHPELMTPLGIPGALLAGRQSHVIGTQNIESAAREWQLPLRWFEQSGHFPFTEEPQAFVDAVFEVIGRHGRSSP